MSYKRLNFATNLYFYLILLSGISYTTLLVFAIQKIMPASIMQIIFLFDTLKFDNSIVTLITSPLFLFNIIPGIFLIGLILKFGKSLIKFIKNIRTTRQMIRNLEIVKTNKKYLKFNSKETLIFTSGLVSPKIFISSALFKSHRPQELTAMIQHEENHKKNYHPLKIFVVNFVRSILPSLPGKNWLVDNYLTLVEVSSDQFSESKINSKLPLVSALLKFQRQSFNPGITYFNSQSERIKILVGQKKYMIKIPMVYYSLLLVGIFSSALLVKNTNIFYECKHLLKCVELLIAPDSKPILSPTIQYKNVTSVSDHCQ